MLDLLTADRKKYHLVGEVYGSEAEKFNAEQIRI